VPAPHPEQAWDALDRFLQELQKREPSPPQIRLVLETVRQSTHADVVYWYPGTSGEALEVVGEPQLSPLWYTAFAQGVLHRSPEPRGYLLLPSVQPLPGQPPPAPLSAVLVQLSRSRQVWVVALNFGNRRPFQTSDLKLMTLAKRILLTQRQHAALEEQLKDSLFGLVNTLVSAIEAKDAYTCGHSERVARMAVRLGRQMGLSNKMLSDVYLAGLLHDIGKIGVRDSVLQKKGPVTPEEFAHIREHTVIGDRILANLKQMQHLRPGVRNHHERWDGNGYPDGLAGEKIPLLARVLAVADSCDAMLSARPYRPGLTPADIDKTMMEGAGKQWDPAIIGHFLACRHELYPIHQQGLGESLVRAVEEEVAAVRQNVITSCQLSARAPSVRGSDTL
jgi:HD-GYP domain-containing protein (c-di-GMP phosphodiesterase class II)